jgi:signal transduction histidine kinase
LGNAEASKESNFVGAVNRSFIIAGLIAGVAALLVTLLLSRRILGPIEALTGAVRRLERGDLSQRVEVHTKDEIGELAHAFNAMADGLARTEQLRRNMVSDIAHELRTPLTNLRCQIEALQDGLAKPSSDVLQSLHEEAMLLKTLIDDLQDLALAEAGQLRLDSEAVSVLEAGKQAMTAFEAQAEGKGIALKINMPSDLPSVYADAKRVGQILRNLLANAIAHTPSGGVVEVTARTKDDAVELVVSDTGTGIEPEHLPNIFERFYRVDGSRARSTGGAGLGLAIVKQLAEAQGGGVRVESEVGKGTTFIIKLPCRN